MLSLATALVALTATPIDQVLQKPQVRVTFVGDTLIERAQHHCYLETILTVQFPNKHLTFRNLGWSGDTPTGLSRAYFDPPAAGRKRLIEQVKATQPDLLLVGYGMANSFDREAGLEPFRQSLFSFLKDTAGPQVLLMSPIAHEDLNGRLPNPDRHNGLLAAYTRVVSQVAQERSVPFINAFAFNTESPLGTSNGIHLTEEGYYRWALRTVESLKLNIHSATVTVSIDDKKIDASGAEVKAKDISDSVVRLEMTDDRLPVPVSPGSDDFHTAYRLVFKGLAEGNYQLRASGRVIKEASAQQWAKGLAVSNLPQHEQAEQLRQKIITKNQMYFQHYRPQNITYLLGFRRHEQGQNAIELDKLLDHVRNLEQEISDLRVPKPVAIELIRQ